MIGTDHLDGRLPSFDRSMAQGKLALQQLHVGANRIRLLHLRCSEIRPAISADGKKVYAVFNRVFSINGNQRVGDVILVRDDDGGNSGPLRSRRCLTKTE